MLRGMMQRSRPGPRSGGPYPFPTASGELPAALAATLGARRTVAARDAIEPVTHGGTAAAGGSRSPAARTVEAERLVLATPAAATALLLAPLAPERPTALRTIPHAPGRDRLRSASERRRPRHRSRRLRVRRGARRAGPMLLGCQYESSVFPDRAPAGGVLIRGLLGGAFAPAWSTQRRRDHRGQAVFRPAPDRRASPRSRLRRRLARAARHPAVRPAPTPARIAAVDDAVAKLPRPDRNWQRPARRRRRRLHPRGDRDGARRVRRRIPG